MIVPCALSEKQQQQRNILEINRELFSVSRNKKCMCSISKVNARENRKQRKINAFELNERMRVNCVCVCLSYTETEFNSYFIRQQVSKCGAKRIKLRMCV